MKAKKQLIFQKYAAKREWTILVIDNSVKNVKLSRHWKCTLLKFNLYQFYKEETESSTKIENHGCAVLIVFFLYHL